MKGIYSALLVSFDKDGNINEKGLREIIRHNIDVCSSKDYHLRRNNAISLSMEIKSSLCAPISEPWLY